MEKKDGKKHYFLYLSRMVQNSGTGCQMKNETNKRHAYIYRVGHVVMEKLFLTKTCEVLLANAAGQLW